MISVDKRIGAEEVVLLKGLIGKELREVEAAIAAPPNVAWNTVRLHADAYFLDINCFLDNVAINDEGDADEFGVISVISATNDNLKVKTISSDTEELIINKQVTRIEVFETKIISKYGKVPFCEKQFTKAIVFYFEDECMVIDKLAWFDEMLRVSFGSSPEKLLYDESLDWESDIEEDGVAFEYSLKKSAL